MSFHAAIHRFTPDVSKAWAVGAAFAGPVRSAAGNLPLVDAAIAGLRSETDYVRILMVPSSTGHFTDRQPGCREALWRVVRERPAGRRCRSADHGPGSSRSRRLAGQPCGPGARTRKRRPRAEPGSRLSAANLVLPLPPGADRRGTRRP